MDDAKARWENYLKGIPALAAGEEARLFAAIRAGDEAARSRLVEVNLPLVEKVAKSYRKGALSWGDLMMCGAVGLMQAAEKFDPTGGFRFETYAAFWVRNSIERGIKHPQKS